MTAALLDRIADLEEQVAYYKGELGLLRDADDYARLRARWGLTPMEAALVLALYARVGHTMSRASLMDALYSNRPQDEPAIKIIDVMVCKARAKLGRGFIRNAWGRGYYLEASAVEALDAVLEKEKPKCPRS